VHLRNVLNLRNIAVNISLSAIDWCCCYCYYRLRRHCAFRSVDMWRCFVRWVFPNVTSKRREALNTVTQVRSQNNGILNHTALKTSRHIIIVIANKMVSVN